MTDLIDRLCEKIDFDDECWIWTGSRATRGYGRVKVNGKVKQASRIVYEQTVGLLDDEVELDHLCRNTSCVNPDHLEPVTHRENVRRGNGWAGVNAKATHCRQGHPYDEENTYLWRQARYCRACLRARAQRRRHP